MFFLIGIVIIVWIIGKENLSDNQRIVFSFLVLIIALALQMSSIGPGYSGGSYLQEVCPDCDQW